MKSCIENRLIQTPSQDHTRSRKGPHRICSSSTPSEGASQQRLNLGRSGLQVSKLGIGTLQWGDPNQGFGNQFTEAGLKEIFTAAIDKGVNFFDTAEVYGYQGIKNGTCSEDILGKALAAIDAPEPVIIGTKFFTIPWTNFLVGGGLRLGKDSIKAAFKASLQRLGRIDLYQVHFPFPTFPQQILADALTEIFDEGKIKAVGVCNYDNKQLERLYMLLQARGITLASNQVKFNILQQSPLKSGLLKLCKDLDVTLIAHSPLSQGQLTEGDRLRPLLKLLQFIGAISGGKPISQVALNYLTAQGAVPIPGTKSVAQLQDHLGSLKWELEENELEMIKEKVTSMGL